MDALDTIYFVSFVAGAAFTAGSWILGRSRVASKGGGRRIAIVRGSSARAPARIAAPAAPARGGPSRRAALRHGLLAPLLDITAWTVLACVAGGTGYIARRLGLSPIESAAWAIPLGLGAALLASSLTRWLERESQFEEPFAIEGTVATVLKRINAGGTGEVVYSARGSRRFLPAVGEAGRAIEVGTEVIILRISGGIAEVTQAPELFGEVRSL